LVLPIVAVVLLVVTVGMAVVAGYLMYAGTRWLLAQERRARAAAARAAVEQVQPADFDKLEGSIHVLAESGFGNAFGLASPPRSGKRASSPSDYRTRFLLAVELINKASGVIQRIRDNAVTSQLNEQREEFDQSLGKLRGDLSGKNTELNDLRSTLQLEWDQNLSALGQRHTQNLADKEKALMELRETLETAERLHKVEKQHAVAAVHGDLDRLRVFINGRLGGALKGCYAKGVPAVTEVVGPSLPQENDIDQILAVLETLLGRLSQDWQKRLPDPALQLAIEKARAAVQETFPNFNDRHAPNGIISYCQYLLARESTTADEARSREELVVGLIEKARQIWNLR
jgi:hypothetical protein